MPKRKQPFGYYMAAGEIKCHPKEAELVCHIFRQYLAGASFTNLADELSGMAVPYNGSKPWNKNIIARILEDTRYAGEKGYPAIISRETMELSLEKRMPLRQKITQTETFKVIRQLCGQPATARMEQQILEMLNSEDSVKHQRQPSRNELDPILRELEEALNQLPLDEERAKSLAMQAATARYQAIGPEEYETEKLRRQFKNMLPMQKLEAGLLRAAVSAIQAERGNIVSLRLKNGQIIERPEKK